MKLRSLGILAACLVLLSSCEAFFSTNLFKEAKLGQESASSISSKTSAEIAASASTGDNSSFYDVLKAEPATKTAVLDTLAATYTDPAATPADVQTAAAAAAKIELVTTGADGIVNNIVGVLADLPSTGIATMTPDKVLSALDTLVPPALLADQTAFTAAVDALLASQTALTALGSSVGTDGVAEIDTATIGTAAQTALVASVIDAIDLTKVDVPGSPAGTHYPDAPSLLWAILQPGSTVDTSTLALKGTYSPTAAGPLNNLLMASGLDLSKFNL